MKKIIILFFISFFANGVKAQELEWAKQLTTAEGASIAVDVNGNVYTCGEFALTTDFDPGPGVYNLSTGFVPTVFISKLDASGNFVWVKQIAGVGNGAGNVIPSSLDIDAYGALYTTGFFIGTVDFDPGVGTFNLSTVILGNAEDIFISKLDAAGNFIWAQQFGGTDDDLGRSINLLK